MMYGAMGGLILLLAVAIYSAVAVGRETDQVMLRLHIEDFEAASKKT